jgi:hypothetical protein
MLTVKITPNDKGNPPGKLADVELHFSDDTSPLAGPKLIGFSIWERRGGTARNVPFPARSYSVNGERRSFALGGRLRDASVEQIGPKVWDLTGLRKGAPALEISALKFPKRGAQLKVRRDGVGLLPLK